VRSNRPRKVGHMMSRSGDTAAPRDVQPPEFAPQVGECLQQVPRNGAGPATTWTRQVAPTQALDQSSPLVSSHVTRSHLISGTCDVPVLESQETCSGATQATTLGRCPKPLQPTRVASHPGPSKRNHGIVIFNVTDEVRSLESLCRR
jgi:hypothetical protein